jgi:excisionase family DNA binding protein
MAREFLTLAEIAEMVGCTRRFLEMRIRDGELKVFRPSSRIVRVRKSEFERWIEQFSSGGERLG